jgi:PIN domain nuclease of toxin-antitoxin system
LIAYLDTHVVVWLAQGQLASLSPRAASHLETDSLLIAPMVLLELEYLYEIGRVRLSSREILRKVEFETGVQVCDLPFPAVAAVALDEKWTRDPFDRMIVAQAKANGFSHLISSDQEIGLHYTRTVW